MSGYNERRVPLFTDELEWIYQLKYKETPYDTFIRMRNSMDHNVSAVVQERMDAIWKEYREKLRLQAEQEQFHSVEETPFTETEQDIPDHPHKIRTESPVNIFPEYDICGEQMEFAFI